MPVSSTPVITILETQLNLIVCYAENVEIFYSLVNEVDRDVASFVAVFKKYLITQVN
jgi:hypothetical protein